MDFGLLVLRVAIGVTISAHGFQKLFGWFGGPGFRAMPPILTEIGYRAALPMTVLAIAGELGALSLAAGFLTPIAATGVIAIMVNAYVSVQRRIGFFNSNGGYEYNIVVVGAAVALAAVGPGDWSLDHALGWDGMQGTWWGVGALAVGVLGSLAMLAALFTAPGQLPAAVAARHNVEDH